jgi:hypothetical protein
MREEVQENRGQKLTGEQATEHKKDLSSCTKVAERCTRGVRRLRIVEISKEVECSEWPKRRLLQTIRDMRAERERWQKLKRRSTWRRSLRLRTGRSRLAEGSLPDSRGCYRANHSENGPI